jgi:RNA polymerase sigma factor (TIGR02999 family)
MQLAWLVLRMEQPSDITLLLQQADAGDEGSIARLLPLVYNELRQLAHQQMNSERKDHTLQATALVHEAFIRLARTDGPASRGSRYFFAAAGEAMRRILVEHARARARIKRGGDGLQAPQQLPISGFDAASTEVDDRDMLKLDAALSRLEQEDAEVAQMVRLRFFAGLSGEETALALGVSARSVDRDWAFARARLFQLMQETESPV